MTTSARRELGHDGLAARGSEIEGDRPLVRIGNEEAGRLADALTRLVAQKGRAIMPIFVAASGALELHDFGSEVGEYLRGDRRCNELSEFEHLDAREGQIAHFHLPFAFESDLY